MTPDVPASQPPPLLAPSLTHDGALLGNARGGARRGATYVGDLHLKLAADFEAAGLAGLSAYLDVMTIHGGRPVLRVGDAQGVSNLAGPNGTTALELWFEYDLDSLPASVLAGIYDLNSEFYKLRAAGLFLASPFGVGTDLAQSGAGGPSIFPRTSAGLRVAAQPSQDTVLRAAVLDGRPLIRADGSSRVFAGGDGLLLIGEVAWASARRGDADLPGPTHARNRVGRLATRPPYADKLAVGAWRYTGRFADLGDRDDRGAPLERRGTFGAYLAGEHLLVGSPAADTGRVSTFVQAGLADARVNRFGAYFGVGIVASGWAPLRASDEIGLALAHARNGGHALRAYRAQGIDATPAETTVELTWLTALGEHVTLQPALQRVLHPNTDPALANAWVGQLRIEIAY